jgi:hypothetical protein
MRTSAALGTVVSCEKSLVIFPMMFTAEAARISLPCEAGVGPKNMQKAFPVGQ